MKCKAHEIVYIGLQCPMCKAEKPPKVRRGRRDGGKTPLLKLGGIKKQRVYGKA